MRLSVLAVGTNSDHMLRYIKYCDAKKVSDIHIDVFLTTINAPINVFGRDKDVYGVTVPILLSFLLRMPYIRNLVGLCYQTRTFRRLLKNNIYSLVCIHQLHPYTLSLTRIAKKSGIKVLLTPWGSDVLRASEKQKRRLKRAFSIADYVSSDLSVGFTDKFVQMYEVDRNKLVDAWYGSDVISSIYQQKQKVNKISIAKEFMIPTDRYYITCGYAANHTQRHINMIEAIGKNKRLFPKDPFLVFPFTYGPDKYNNYQAELENLCSQYELDYYFVKDYMPIEKVARLRLLSDLYFHILPTDAYSASLIEYILAGSICINGKWLDYPSLEKYQKPYYIVEDLAELPFLVRDIFKTVPKTIDILKDTENIILTGSWSVQINNWYRFFKRVSYCN